MIVSFLYLCLNIAVVLLVAAAIVWICSLFGFGIDPTVYKIGKIIVLIIVLILVVSWLLGALGGGVTSSSPFPRWRW